MNKRIKKKKNKYSNKFIKRTLRLDTHLRVYPIIGDLPNDGMKALNIIRNLRRAHSYVWNRENNHQSIKIHMSKIHMSSVYGFNNIDHNIDPYDLMYKRPITMFELFVHERKLRKEKIVNLKKISRMLNIHPWDETLRLFNRNYTENLKI